MENFIAFIFYFTLLLLLYYYIQTNIYRNNAAVWLYMKKRTNKIKLIQCEWTCNCISSKNYCDSRFLYNTYNKQRVTKRQKKQITENEGQICSHKILSTTFIVFCQGLKIICVCERLYFSPTKPLFSFIERRRFINTNKPHKSFNF